MKGKIVVGILCCLLLFAVYIAPASASISSFQDVSLYGGVTVTEDGWLSAGTFWGTLGAPIPSGATVSNAYLYMSFWNLDPGERSVDFAGNSLGDPYPWVIATDGQASTARKGVSAYVTGPGSYGITVSAVGGASYFYGAALVVIYSKPSAAYTRIIIQDGIRAINIELVPPSPNNYYRVSFTGISTASVTAATLWAMGQGGSSAYPGELDELRVNGVLKDNNAFREADGQAWDVNWWDVLSQLGSTVDVDFYGGSTDGYFLDFVILEVTYVPAPPPAVPEFSSLPAATSLALMLLIGFLAVQKRFGKRKR